jgi:hypothetical protein
MLISRVHLSVAAFAAAILFTACEEDSAAKPADESAPTDEAFLFATSVRDGDSSSTSYVLVLSDLTGEVDLKQSIEVPGNPSVFTQLGAVFIGNPEDMTVTRYELGEKNALVEGRRLSLMGEGVTMLNGSLFFVIDAKRAYYIDLDGRQIIVWDPTAMEITDTVPLLDLEREGLDARVIGANEASTWLLQDTGKLYLPVSWTRDDDLRGEAVVALLRIDADEPSEQELFTSDCAAVSDEGLMLGLDGNIYLAGTNSWNFLREFGDMPESAIAKFDMASQSFDPDYCQSIPSLTGGHEAGTAIAYAPGEFVVRAVDKSLAEVGGIDTYYADIENACRFYHGEIDEDGELSLTEEPDLGTAPHYCWGWVYKIDGDPYFWGEDRMYMWDGSRMVPKFEARGYAAAFQRIR